MTKVLLGIADQATFGLVTQVLAERVDFEIVGTVGFTTELDAAVGADHPDVVLLHDALQPDPAPSAVMNLVRSHPVCAVVVLTAQGSTEFHLELMEAGARAVVGLPPGYEELVAKVDAAVEHTERMRDAIGGELRAVNVGHGRVVAFAGAKGGVGTTTVAVHLALDSLQASERRTVLVDLDLEKGDVASLVKVRHPGDIGDLAKLTIDLSPRNIADTVVPHESGLHLLLTPPLRDIEYVTTDAVRRILGALRQNYDLVVVDAGSHPTPVQATVVGQADDVVVVVTPDTLAMRSLHRELSAWDELNVHPVNGIRVLVNRIGTGDRVQSDDFREIMNVPLVGVGLPAGFRGLEPAFTAQDPENVRSASWRKAIRAVADELGLGRASDQSGSVVLETVGVVPLVLLVVLLCWQMALIGLTFVWSGQAADAAVRAVSVGGDPMVAARARLPDGVADAVEVSTQAGQVHVSVAAPLVVPGFATLPLQVDSTRTVVAEPGR